MNSTTERIQTRAYELFVNRDGNGGGQLDDWLKAEIEIERKTAVSPIGNTHHQKTTFIAGTKRS
jgi:hypothetical protein